jgi:chlorobactene glucosyltransferase
MSALAVAVLILWLSALALATINILLVPRLRESTAGADAPFVSMIIPARNEERAIEGTLRCLLLQQYPAFEVILVDDRSSDRTGQIAREISEDEPRLRVVMGEDLPDGWLGKPWALHQGAAVAKGDLLLFLDADIVYHPHALAAAVDFLTRSGAGMIALLPRFVLHGFWEHIAMPQLALTVFASMPLWLANRLRYRLFGLGGGPGNLVRRSVYEQVGGHAAIRDAVIDDVGLARLIRSVAATMAVRADEFVSVRMYQGLRELVHGFTKNMWFALGGTLFGAFVVPVLIVVAHMAPYVWALFAEGTLQRVAIATLVIISFTRLVVFIPLRYGVVNALFGHPFMAAVWFVIFARSTWIVGIQREFGWRGRMYDPVTKKFGG